MEWLGLIGAWLLFAGPIHQAMMELRAELGEQERLKERDLGLEQPKPIPRWLWLLPPLAFYEGRRRSNEYQREYFKQLSKEERADLMHFFNKASGWTYVALGAWFIAITDTYEVVHHHEWHVAWAVLAVVVVTLAAVVRVYTRVKGTELLVEGGTMERPKRGERSKG